MRPRGARTTYARGAVMLRASSGRVVKGWLVRAIEPPAPGESEMKIRTAVLLSLVTLAPLGTARAQISNPLKFTVFAGAALPVGDTQDAVKTGYTVGGALDFRVPLSALGVRGEVVYSGFDVKQSLGSDESGSDFGFNTNVVAWLPIPTAGLIQPYLTAGPSFSRLDASASEAENRWG